MARVENLKKFLKQMLHNIGPYNNGESENSESIKANLAKWFVLAADARLI